jgi:Ca2+-binding EF-hand superfamily protein
MVEYIQYQVGRIEAELKPQDFQGFSPEREPAISEILRQTKEEFGRADVNRDGSISFSEYKKVVKKGRFETEAQQRQTFDKIDTSKEGQVSLQEMVQFRITKKFGKPQAKP